MALAVLFLSIDSFWQTLESTSEKGVIFFILLIVYNVSAPLKYKERHLELYESYSFYMFSILFGCNWSKLSYKYFL